MAEKSAIFFAVFAHCSVREGYNNLRLNKPGLHVGNLQLVLAGIITAAKRGTIRNEGLKVGNIGSMTVIIVRRQEKGGVFLN